MKCPARKSFFAVLQLNLFRAIFANADIGSLKFLHTFLKKLFVPHASEIWPGNLNKIVWSKLHEIFSFLTKNKQKNVFLSNQFWQNFVAILEDVSVVETIV